MVLDETKFKHVTVAGDTVMSVKSAISADALCKILLEKYGFEDVSRGQFYPMGNYLALIHDIEERMPAVLKRVGEFICRDALLSPQITNFEQLMPGMDAGYHRNHNGQRGDEIGHFDCEKKSQKEFIISVETPYPCIFDQGIIFGFAKKFDTSITVEHADNSCRTRGDSQCNFHVLVKD